MSYEIGIDVGGTFTDFVIRSSDNIFSGKVLTTPNDETVGIMNASEPTDCNKLQQTIAI